MKGANVFPCSSSSKISFGGIKLLPQTLLFILIILSLCSICFPHIAEELYLLNRCSFEILTKFLFFSEKFSDTPNKFPYISFFSTALSCRCFFICNRIDNKILTSSQSLSIKIKIKVSEKNIVEYAA